VTREEQYKGSERLAFDSIPASTSYTAITYTAQELILCYHFFVYTYTTVHTRMSIPILIIGSAVLTGVDMVREHKAKKRALRANEAGLPAPVGRTPATENATEQLYDEELPAYDEEEAPPYREAEERHTSKMHKCRARG
jgi:hypothetical protein